MHGPLLCWWCGGEGDLRLLADEGWLTSGAGSSMDAWRKLMQTHGRGSHHQRLTPDMHGTHCKDSRCILIAKVSVKTHRRDSRERLAGGIQRDSLSRLIGEAQGKDSAQTRRTISQQSLVNSGSLVQALFLLHQERADRLMYLQCNEMPCYGLSGDTYSMGEHLPAPWLRPACSDGTQPRKDEGRAEPCRTQRRRRFSFGFCLHQLFW